MHFTLRFFATLRITLPAVWLDGCFLKTIFEVEEFPSLDQNIFSFLVLWFVWLKHIMAAICTDAVMAWCHVWRPQTWRTWSCMLTSVAKACNCKYKSRLKYKLQTQVSWAWCVRTITAGWRLQRPRERSQPCHMVLAATLWQWLRN